MKVLPVILNLVTSPACAHEIAHGGFAGGGFRGNVGGGFVNRGFVNPYACRWVPPATLEALKREADKRGMVPTALVREALALMLKQARERLSRINKRSD
jgi:hypothetical protein